MTRVVILLAVASRIIGGAYALVNQNTFSDFQVDEVNCSDFKFNIQLDRFPEDTKYVLVDSNKGIIWDNQQWDISEQGYQLEQYACLPVEGCYTFIIFDSDEYQDG